MKRIHQIGSPVLRTETPPVKTFDARLGHQLDQMHKVMRQAPGVGLAANQIGWFVRAFVFDDGTGHAGEMLNPEMVWRDEEEVEHKGEGCLSVGYANLRANVFRARRCRVAGQDRMGQPIEVEGEGFLSFILQHEVDHLNGLLFIDRTRGAERARVHEQLRDLSIIEAAGPEWMAMEREA